MELFFCGQGNFLARVFDLSAGLALLLLLYHQEKIKRSKSKCAKYALVQKP